MLSQPGHTSQPKARRWAWWAVLTGVLLGHLLVTQGVLSQLVLADSKDEPTINRMEVELAADMQLSEPPVATVQPAAEAVPALPSLSEAQAPAAPASAASQPEALPEKPPAEPAMDSASAPEPGASAPLAASAPEETASTAVAAASSPEAVVSSAAKDEGPVFEWPQATRVTFKMEGYLRGPIYGSALVEWVRQDLKYQVHVDAYAGPSFAPVASQRWTSEGEITPDGLKPQRFESINKLLIKTNTPKVVTFEDKALVMPNGERMDKLDDVQDPASHYIQMAYHFMRAKLRLEVGRTIEMPVADTRKQRMLIYDVESKESLQTPLGEIETFKLKPRVPKTSKGEDVMAELWIAPSLQYLPIRMLIRIGDQTYFDMQMDKAPQQTSAK